MRTSRPRSAAAPFGGGLTVILAGCSTAGTTASTTPNPASTSTYTLIQVPQAGYQPIYDFISSAEQTVDMTMYALSDPQADAALIADAKRGVAVRVLLNSDCAGGGGAAVNQAAYDELNSSGVTVKWAWPGVLRHQKSIVVDGTKAAVMTCNLDASYYATLRDFVVISDNRATASGITATFDADFNNTSSPPTRGVVPVGSELIWSPGAQAGLVNLIGAARPGSTLYTENEQLDSTPVEQALVADAAKGVTVDVVMTYPSSYVNGFDALIAGGVHVHVYYSQTPLHIQAKALSINGKTVYVGSINYVTSSTNDDRNMWIITTDATAVRGTTTTMASDFAGATLYNPSSSDSGSLSTTTTAASRTPAPTPSG